MFVSMVYLVLFGRRHLLRLRMVVSLALFSRLFNVASSFARSLIQNLCVAPRLSLPFFLSDT